MIVLGMLNFGSLKSMHFKCVVELLETVLCEIREKKAKNRNLHVIAVILRKIGTNIFAQNCRTTTLYAISNIQDQF